MNVELLRQYAALKESILETESQTKERRAQLAALEDQILDEFSRDGVRSLNVDGATIYLRRETRARRNPDIEEADFLQAMMKSPGFSYLVKPSVNAQSLTRAVKDLEEAEETLPPEVERVVKVDEVFRLGVRRS